MFKILAFLIFLFSSVLLQPADKIFSTFHQNDYYVEYERAVLVRYNKSYVDNPILRAFKYNRTAFAMNASVTVKLDLGTDIIVVSQVYKFLSNEYRYFPIRVQINLCKGLQMDLMGFGSYGGCSNFSGCPIRKGAFYVCNFMNNWNKLPPFIPAGRYKVDFQGFHHGTELGLIEGYGAVKRSINIH